MAISKQKTQSQPTQQTPKKGISDRVRYLILIGVLSIITVGININTVRNYYNLDDFHIAKNNPDFEQGIRAIPRIFVTQYSSDEDKSYGYRPLIRTSFAIEYQFFGKNPYISHFFNVVLYLIIILLLYKILRRLLRDYHYLFPFIITLLFAAHPIHTEVVASLKNRDELIMLLFGLLALSQSIKFADTRQNKHIYLAMVYFFLSALSKPTAAAFFFVIPLSLYFFTDLELKPVLKVAGLTALISLVAVFGPFLYLPAHNRSLAMLENPLSVQGGFLNHIAYAGFTLYYYLRLLILPHPLRYYYGYNMFPDINFSNIWVILGLIFHIGLLIYALMTLKKKHILSFAILVYLISIFLFSNLVKPSPGIIAERFLLVPSFAFCFVLAYFIFRLFFHDPADKKLTGIKTFAVLLITGLILIPYSAKTFVRNKQWRTEYSLYKADMPYLYNSYKGNDLYANEIMKNVNRELAKPVNVLKFVEPQIKEAMSHWQRAIEILPDASSPYRNLGIIYSRIYKNYDTALVLFNKALKIEPDDPMILFNLGMTYEGKKDYLKAIDYLQKSLAADSTSINTRSRMANIYYGMGEFRQAIKMNQDIMRMAPKESLPYINIGNYYIFQKDTLNGIRYYEKAVELGAPPDASNFLSKYFQLKGDQAKYNYYKKLSEDLQKKKTEL